VYTLEGLGGALGDKMELEGIAGDEEGAPLAGISGEL
jgi:hypothetical protein